jgi:serine/threonine protein kinase
MGNCGCCEEKKDDVYYQQFLKDDHEQLQQPGEARPGVRFADSRRGGGGVGGSGGGASRHTAAPRSPDEHDGAPPVPAPAPSATIEQVSYEAFCARYTLTGEALGVGHTARVFRVLENNNAPERALPRYGVQEMEQRKEWAVKVVHKPPGRRCAPVDCGCAVHTMVRREVATLAGLDHPHVVRLREVLETPADIYIVTELLRGRELFDVVASRHHFTEREAAALVRRLVQALHYLHAHGVAHRDLKPENVMFADEDENLESVKIIDFGFSKAFAEPMLEEEGGGGSGALPREMEAAEAAVPYSLPEGAAGDGDDWDDSPNTPPTRRPASLPEGGTTQRREAFHTQVGTPGYVAPEVQSGRPYDKACDVWSLGIVTYALLCGYLPFKATTLVKDSPYAAGVAGGRRGASADGARAAVAKGANKRNNRGRFLLRFPEKHWGGVSDEAKHFVSQMLAVQASQRLTAAQLQQHPWLYVKSETAAAAEESGRWARHGRGEDRAGENRISLSTVELLRANDSAAAGGGSSRDGFLSASKRLGPMPADTKKGGSGSMWGKMGKKMGKSKGKKGYTRGGSRGGSRGDEDDDDEDILNLSSSDR